MTCLFFLIKEKTVYSKKKKKLYTVIFRKFQFQVIDGAAQPQPVRMLKMSCKPESNQQVFTLHLYSAVKIRNKYMTFEI